MNDEDHQTSSQSGSCRPTGKSAVSRSADGESGSTVTWCGDAARVREGFAIALELLGLNAPMVDDVTRAQSEDGE
jgi:hypothetical protein